jgi:hypothetical protein
MYVTFKLPSMRENVKRLSSVTTRMKQSAGMAYASARPTLTTMGLAVLDHWVCIRYTLAIEFIML